MNKLYAVLSLIVLFTICLFFLLFILFEKNPNKPPSVLINKEVPKFITKNLFNKNIYLSSDNLVRNVNITPDENINLTEQNIDQKFTLINFFASWCAPCKAEHHIFFKLKKKYPSLFLLGIAHKDDPNDAKKYLSEEGNPYTFVGIDNDGKIALEFGVFGLPETFIINYKGEIVYKHTGPLTEEIVNDEIKLLF
tara:strand:- start:36103 stop:36684 length:582 start_codon:yes stop_codon:yes gene_type:complete